MDEEPFFGRFQPLPGLRTVNRSGFLVTTVPWEDRELVVKLD